MKSLQKQKLPLWQRLSQRDGCLPFLNFAYKPTRNLRLPSVLLLICFFFIPHLASASLLSEEFKGVNDFQRGLAVSIQKDSPTQIEPLDISNSEYLVGVVVDSGESVVTFSKQESTVNVALSGEVDVYVNNANGDIAEGDFVGASWLQGVGMKALTDDKQKLLGIALENFDSSKGSSYGEVDTASGKKEISIGTIKIRLFDKEGQLESLTDSKGVEGLLQDLAGKDISTIKVLAGSLVFIISLLISAMFIVASIKGSFTSIGRNPLASSSIYRSLLHVSGISVAIILMGTALAYVVLVI